MFKVGIDLVEITRIKKSVENQRFIERVFSKKEIALFSAKDSAFQSMAGNWAAKEAFSKSLGTGVSGFSLNEVSVLRDEKGAPFIELTGKALRLAEGYEFSVSITHTDDLAQAVVIAYRKGE